ncbi:hypothetical protein EV182_000068 [Spiromyces aspiralis]|uniref:Uncharacterized protein n=1 Tax=Spiromyces aspiralis TaxID=68401 RepID=A0ACC1HV16_9FUNG|nr:hypothetical protein EV182_000068 [Spiromyces aspiralis]
MVVSRVRPRFVAPILQLGSVNSLALSIAIPSALPGNLREKLADWWAGLNRGAVDIAEVLRESILWAAPKQRTSHSKKRMRASNKALKNRKDIVPCPGCGRPKLMAHVCQHCYKDLRRTMKNIVPGSIE